MASLPLQIPLASIGSTCTNKNTFVTPCIAQLHNNNKKKKHYYYFAKPIKFSSPPIMPIVEQCHNAEKWKTWCKNTNNNDGSSGVAPEEHNLSPQHSLVLEFYDAFNHKNIERLKQLLSPHHCSYDDILFYGPYEGTQSVLNFLQSAMDALGPNVRIRLEDVDEHNHFAITVFWHLEWQTKKIPFTKGCRIFEFEEVEGKLLISQITGLEELPVKPGELMLKVLKTIRTLFDNYPMAAAAILDSHSSQENRPHGGTDTHFDLFGRGH